MTLITSRQLLSEIWRHGQSAYPEEGAGLLLGQVRGEDRIATVLRPLPNSFRAEARSRRYQISPQEMMAAEEEADALGLQLIGVFHSHPDHPAVASEFDREWGLPWFSYLITSVAAGRAVESRSWRLLDDRSRMVEETLSVLEEVSS